MQERKIIQQSRSFKDLDRTLKKLIKNKKAKLAGSIFEYLTKLFLEVSHSNVIAEKFYNHFDFYTVGIRRNYYKDGSDALLKEKKLTTK